MGYDLSQLNPAQIKPVMDTEGAVLVTAGAGSGKTRLLTHRIAYIIEELHVPAYQILAITFTNKAAKEMKSRLYEMIPNARGLWVSTFHSMCVTILRNFIDKIGFTANFSIYGEYEKEKIIKKLVQELYPDEEDDFFKTAANEISAAKNDGLDPDDYLVQNSYKRHADSVSNVFLHYNEELRKSNALDFDDLLAKAYLLLASSLEARTFYQERFRYIHVDEFQDTNKIQYKLISILSAKHKNIFVVGDEDQSIYGWRGANIDNMRNFIKDFNCRIYKLEQNYRSTKTILDLANRIIQNNSSRIEKNLWTDKTGGVRVECYAAYKDSDEADYVVSCILNLVSQAGYKYSDCAILMRINALTRPFEQRLLQYNIPYKIFGGFKFFERKEVKDMLAYLRILVNPYDNEALLRVINFPKRGIGDSTIKQLVNYALVQNQSLFQTVIEIEQNMDLPNAVIAKVSVFSKVIRHLLSAKDKMSIAELIAFETKVLDLETLYQERTEENENRILHIRELIESAQEYVQKNPQATLEEYLQMITLYTDLDEMDAQVNCVNLATVHSAKGLEFKVVFIVGAEDGIFPISRAVDFANELEEERRLMYVAITRAEERLYITRTRTRFLYGQQKDSMPSRFLKELGLIQAAPERQFARSDRYTDESQYSEGSAGNDRNYGAVYQANVVRPIKRQEDMQGYAVGKRVRHKRFGEGVIKNITNTGGYCAEIEFEKVGTLSLVLSFAPLEILGD